MHAWHTRQPLAGAALTVGHNIGAANGCKVESLAELERVSLPLGLRYRAVHVSSAMQVKDRPGRANYMGSRSSC